MTADTSKTHSNNTSTALSAEQIARSVQITRAALDHGADELPYEISERLRAIRMRALAQAQQKPVQTVEHNPTVATTVSQWQQQLFGWLKGGIAVGAFALALVISVVSIRSELTTDVAVSDRAISMSSSASSTSHEPMTASKESDTTTLPANAAINNGKNTNNSSNTLLSMSNHARASVAHPPERNNPASENTAYGHANAMSARPTTAPASTVASAELAYSAATTPQAVHSTAVEDDEIAMVLHEQIPLQAYLNDDFARYANHQGLNNIEKLNNATNNTTSTNAAPNE